MEEEKKPKFKLGQLVRVKKRTKKACEYPLTFVDDMQVYSGRTFKIESRNQSYTPRNEDEDGYSYKLGSIDRFNFSSPMLEPVNENKTEPQNKIPSKYNVGDRVKIIFPEEYSGDPRVLKKHVGEVRQIVEVKNIDSFTFYKLQGNEDYWAESCLKPIEKSTEQPLSTQEVQEDWPVIEALQEFVEVEVEDWPEDAKYKFGQRVKTPENVYDNDHPCFVPDMLDCLGEEGIVIECEKCRRSTNKLCYRIGDSWWCENLLIPLENEAD